MVEKCDVNTNEYNVQYINIQKYSKRVNEYRWEYYTVCAFKKRPGDKIIVAEM